jgi:hypothetical protein
MKQNDKEHLRLLSIFHYVVGGLTALFALFPIFHLIFGLVMVLAPHTMEADGEQPPVFIGWFFVIFAGVLIALGLIIATLVVTAGRYLARQKHYLFCLVVAGLECMLMPYGTVLGVFTIIVLMRESVKELFSANQSVERTA